MRKNCVNAQATPRTGREERNLHQAEKVPSAVPIAMAMKLMAILRRKPVASSGVHLTKRRQDRRHAGRGERVADADRDAERGDERERMPTARAPALRRSRLRRAEPERQEDRKIAAVRDHDGA